MLFPVVHPTERLLYRCLSFHRFPSNAALRCNWAKNIRRVESKGVLTINSSTRLYTKHFTAKLYHVSSRKECARPRGQVILKSNAIPRVFNCFLNNCNPLPASGKHPLMPQMETCGRTCAVGCTAGNMQHSGVAYLQSVEKCIEYVCTVWRISFHRGKI